ncbi:hypothetical protein [Micromonospora sp. NPDC023633]|uniref:hypothetical protein n=1 Tax=Micromonospora sp. NPDC023633 TaxID=3154320 RepID=UPI0033E66A8E
MATRGGDRAGHPRRLRRHVVWGADLTPAKASHFHLAARPDDRALARVAARLDASRQRRIRSQTAGFVADPATPARRALARDVARPR